MNEHEPVLITEEKLPHREGVGPGKEPTPEDGPLYHQARISKATCLADLEADYAFFTHALLFTHGYWSLDPIRDYIATQDPKCCPVVINTPSPIFKGLKVGMDDSWNHMFLAVLRTQWEGLRAFLGSLSAVDRNRKRYHRLVIQEFPAVDAMALEKATILPDPVPMVPMTFVALEGSWGTVGFAPAKKPPMDRIRVVTEPAVPEVAKLGVAVFAELEKPFQAIEPSVEEAERRAKERIARDKKE